MPLFIKIIKKNYSLLNVGGNERAGALHIMFLPASPGPPQFVTKYGNAMAAK